MMFMSGVQVNTADMWLVYEDSEGVLHEQPWQDVATVGGLIDPVTDEDMPVLGWTTHGE